MTDESDARHQTFANLEALWAAGNPQILPVGGAPWCEIRLDPGAGEASIRTAYGAPEPDLARLVNVAFEAVAVDGVETAVITARVEDNINGVYGLLAAIADGLQVDGLGLAASVASAIERHRDVLSQRIVLSEQVEVGLFGELCFLDHLIQRIGPEAALDAWMGPLSEEHDFVLREAHIEVKTTTSERRRHFISGLSQLVPVGTVPLMLLSIQLTRSPSEGGRTLPGLISMVRRAAGAYAASLDLKLARQGWDPQDADLFQSSWVFRSQPRAYPVDEDFPAMTERGLAAVVPNLSLISDVSYRVDVTDLQDEPLPEPCDGFGIPKKE